jgi:sugar/nucleoside kinase (ribokinase family)
MMDVVTFGEAMALLVAEQPGPLEAATSFLRCTAGAETNVAIGLARLGLRVSWVSRLGGDATGRYLLAAMQREGVDCSQVVCDPAGRTGLMFKARVAGGGDPAIEYHRKGSAASMFAPEMMDIPRLTATRHLHVTGIFPALSPACLATTRRSMQAMRMAGRTISFDPNLRPTLWASPELMRATVNDLATCADWVLPGLEEGRFLTGAETAEGIARFYRERGVQLVIVKLGPAGAYYETAESGGMVPGFPVVRVVDTVGAGDGFAVGAISALLEGCNARDAARRGAWIGARAVQVLGDTEGLPTRADLVAAEFETQLPGSTP